MCRAVLYTPHHKHWKERGEERCITKIAKDGIAALLLLCFPFASVFNRAARARSPARESRFQFEITRVAWHWRRQTKKWRVSTQNGERAEPSPIRAASERPFLPFPILCIASKKAFRTPLSPLFAQCHSKVEMDGNCERGEERRGGGSGCLCLRLCLSLPENERAKVSLIIVAAPSAAGGQLPARARLPCGAVLRQLWWSFVRLSTPRAETRIIMY